MNQASDHGRPSHTWSANRILLVTAAAACITYGTAPLVFLLFAHNPNWADFWQNAGTPYGTMTAGYAAVAAATIAYYNGQQQRHQDQAAADRQQDYALEQLKATTTAAEQQQAHAQSQLDAATKAADREHDASIVRDLRARFTSATQQLSDQTSTIQQAGAYALASLADDWLERTNTQEAQVCIDVLCTYLRTHHHTAAQQHNKPHGENYEYTQPPTDEPVRGTILRILHGHTQTTVEEQLQPGPWSKLNFDLTGAHLHNLDLRGSHFAGVAQFDAATFTGDTQFNDATFSNSAFFDAATFSGDTQFNDATFARAVFFDAATFSGHARFTGATFSSVAGFMMATFAHVAEFDGATFSKVAGFGSARFSGESRFRGATFCGDAWFRNATFSRDAFFDSATFTGASFDDVVIGQAASIHTDWNDDPDRQPENVTPRPWPPRGI